MKLRILALIMTLSLVVWAQGTAAPSAPNSTPAPEAKGCCRHMDHMQDGKGCCHHAQADGKNATGCCGNDKNKCETKDAKSCCQGNDKDMQACMDKCKKEGKGCCGDGKGCSGSADAKSAANCCGNSCPRHPHSTTAS